MKKQNKVGRPSKLDKIDLVEVEKLAALGLTDKEIADWFNICRATLSNYKAQNQEFLDTIKKGKIKADANVTRSLYNKALNGDVTAQIFWLSNRRDGWYKNGKPHPGELHTNEIPEIVINVRNNENTE
jgi:hypothetical protein